MKRWFWRNRTYISFLSAILAALYGLSNGDYVFSVIMVNVVFLELWTIIERHR